MRRSLRGVARLEAGISMRRQCRQFCLELGCQQL
jgi:hypothetical protein